MTTVDQQLLRWAHRSVQAVLKEAGAPKGKYRTAVRGAPAFIQSCGLAQAAAFWLSKGDEFGYGKLLEHLREAPGFREGELDAQVQGAELGRYMFLTRRCQRALVFLKRMVDAYIPREAEDED